MDPEYIVIGVICVVAIAVIIYIQSVRAKKRTAAVQAVSGTLGLTFAGNTWTGDPPPTPLFNRGFARRFVNIMTGSAAGRPLSLFDYHFNEKTGSTGTSSTSREVAQTVAAFSGSSLPAFELIPVGMAQKIGGALGQGGISFDQFPEFAKQYQVKGPDESALRNLFTPIVMSALTSIDAAHRMRVESGPGVLVCYRAGKRSAPDDVKSFLDDAALMPQSLGANTA